MADKLIFELASPSALLASEEANMVVVPGAEGDFGVLPGHTPVLSNLRPGVVDVYNEGAVTKSLFVEGGFVEVTGERCVLLATDAKDVAEISPEEANTRLAMAQEAVIATDDNGKGVAARELIIAEAMKYAVNNRSASALA